VSPADPGGGGAPRRSLKAQALQMLAQREHSRSELRRKLLRRAESASRGAQGDDAARPDAAPGAVDALLDWLEANRYLSQERFVESRVHARAARFGNLRIRQELAQHQVVLPAEAEQSLRDSELGRAREVWARKFAGPGATPAERAKQARFLTGRGFSPEVVRRVLRDAGRAATTEEAEATPLSPPKPFPPS
jgi:regulatory protein